jgi:NlpC/P60 family
MFSMSAVAIRYLFVLVLCAPALRAQPPAHARGARKLKAREGAEILTAAFDFGRTHRAAVDCSHLVHAAYMNAGRPYPYADSSDLYRGIPSFVRVRRPQPGDLVVWRHHSGIVVSPAQHSFYSAVSSGLEVQRYDSGYWKHRGKPRFYRFVISKNEE